MVVKEMNRKDLQEYLSICVDMEREAYIQETAIKELSTRINSLGIPKQFVVPKRPGEQPIKEADIWKTLEYIGFIMFYGGILCAILLLFDWTASFCIPAGLIGFFGGAILADESPRISARKESDYNYVYTKWSEACKQCNQYDKNILEDTKRVERETKEKAALQVELASVQRQNAKTKENLRKIYAVNILYPKYRNFAMVSSLCEYIASGRCDKLEGPDGAYNILETEIRMDKIILQLDSIICNLKKIRGNQFLLYNAINEGNSRLNLLYGQVGRLVDSAKDYTGDLNQLNEKLKKMNENSEMQAYLEKRIYRELQFMNRMNYFSGNYGKEHAYYELPS